MRPKLEILIKAPTTTCSGRHCGEKRVKREEEGAFKGKKEGFGGGKFFCKPGNWLTIIGNNAQPELGYILWRIMLTNVTKLLHIVSKCTEKRNILENG